METNYKKVPIDEIDKYCDLDEIKPIKYGYGVRHVQALLSFMCIAFGYIARGHLGVTIVAMTMVKHENDKPISIAETAHISVNRTIINTITSTESYIENFTAIDDFHKSAISANNKTEIDYWSIYKTYDWPKSIQEMVHGSFFLGYCTMMFPIGLVCQRWGGKIPLQIAMFVNGAVSFLTPWFVAWGGWKAMCALRIIQGLSQSGLYPGTHTLLANWIPVNERGSIASYVLTASGIGTVIAFQSAGILASSRFGWPSTFWATGVMCFSGFILVTVFGAAKPKEHKSISEAEKIYIMGRVGNSVETKAKVPWKSVLRSAPVWASIATHIGCTVFFVFIFMQLSTYMYAVLKFNVRSSGILSSLPYLTSCFSSILFGYLSDFLTNRKIISLKTARRIFNCIACIIPSSCLTLVAFTTNAAFAVTCFIIILTAQAAVHTGWMINYIDLSPNFSGALMATGNTMANILVLALPIIVSNIVLDVTNQYQWRITMFLMAALTFSANIIFVLFMSADVQPWNNGDDDKKDKKEPKFSELQSTNADAAN